MGETARQREQCKKEVRLNGSCDCSSCVIDNATQTESINSNACQTQLCLHTAVKQQYIGPKPAAQLRSSLACRTINKATVTEKSEQKTWHANASANANLRFCGQNGERNVWSQCTVWLMISFSLSLYHTVTPTHYAAFVEWFTHLSIWGCDWWCPSLILSHCYSRILSSILLSITCNRHLCLILKITSFNCLF